MDEVEARVGREALLVLLSKLRSCDDCRDNAVWDQIYLRLDYARTKSRILERREVVVRDLDFRLGPQLQLVLLDRQSNAT